jgi:drug/metabolite transporter superfamily protein YnfA
MNLLQKILVPSLYDGYEWSLKQGILAEQQFGYGVFGIVASYHHKQHIGAGVAAYVVGGVFALTVLTLMFLLRRRLERGGELANNGVWLALVVTTIVLVNPREMQYDLDIALFAGFVLWVYWLRTRRLLVLMILLFLPSLVVPLVVLNPHLHGMYETMLVLAAFALAFWRMWREAGVEQANMKRGSARPVAEIPITGVTQFRKASGA